MHFFVLVALVFFFASAFSGVIPSKDVEDKKPNGWGKRAVKGPGGWSGKRQVFYPDYPIYPDYPPYPEYPGDAVVVDETVIYEK